MQKSKTILIAPLNWGLGHATRCIPVINKLLEYGYNPMIGSDSDSLRLLQKEFPSLSYVELPSYKVSYSDKAYMLKWKIATQVPRLLQVIRKENQYVDFFVKKYKIDGIISDNRYGVYHQRIPSVFITHQVQVLSGVITSLTSGLNRYLIERFDQCWIPDCQGIDSLAGILSYGGKLKIKVRHIGVLSRFEKEEIRHLYDTCVLLSGPEPQRSNFEKIIREQLPYCSGKLILICGKIENEQQVEKIGNHLVYNYMTTLELNKVLNQSDLIVARSGYTTIMDLAKLDKKVFFVPTPGQTEQEYLAKRLAQLQIAPFSKQVDFDLQQVSKAFDYEGFVKKTHQIDWNGLFSVFE